MMKMSKLFSQVGVVSYVGNSANYGVGPDLFLDDYHYTCLDYAPVVDTLRESGRRVFCLEEALGEQNIVFRNTAHLLESELAVGYLKDSSVRHIIPFKTSSQVEKYAIANGWSVLASTSAIGRGLENKMRLAEIAGGARANLPEHIVFDRKDARYEEIAERLGSPFVVQAAKSFAGNQTFKIASGDDFERALAGTRSPVLKASALVSGMPLTVNACATARGVVIGRPVHQITGLKECTANPLGSCGNDFTFAGVDEHRDEIVDLARRIGEVLLQRDYKGIFGIDAVATETGVVLIEVNPRLTASLPMHTVLQIEREETPLIARHIAEFAGIDIADDPIGATELAQRPLEGASLILYNTSEEPVTVLGELAAGAYSLAIDDLVFLRGGSSIADCRVGEIVLSPAAKGKIINPGVEYARLYMRRSAVEADGSLNKESRTAISAIRRKLLGP